MASIKELLEMGDKRTQGEWYLMSTGVYEKENLRSGRIVDSDVNRENPMPDLKYIANAPKMEAKLREIVEMLPEIKSAISGYALLQEDMRLTDINLVPDKCEKLHDKLDKWENS